MDPKMPDKRLEFARWLVEQGQLNEGVFIINEDLERIPTNGENRKTLENEIRRNPFKKLRELHASLLLILQPNCGLKYNEDESKYLYFFNQKNRIINDITVGRMLFGKQTHKLTLHEHHILLQSYEDADQFITPDIHDLSESDITALADMYIATDNLRYALSG